MHQNPVPILLLAFVAAAVLAFRRRYARCAPRGRPRDLDPRRHARGRADHRRHGRVPVALALGRRGPRGGDDRRGRRAVDRRSTARRPGRALVAGLPVAPWSSPASGVARATTADPADAAATPRSPGVAGQLVRTVPAGPRPVLLRGGSATAFEDMKGSRSRSNAPGSACGSRSRPTTGWCSAGHAPTATVTCAGSTSSSPTPRSTATDAPATAWSPTSARSIPRRAHAACSDGTNDSSGAAPQRSVPSSPGSWAGCTPSRCSRSRASRTIGPTEAAGTLAGMRDRVTATVERIPPVLARTSSPSPRSSVSRCGSRSPRGTTCRAAGSTSDRSPTSATRSTTRSSRCATASTRTRSRPTTATIRSARSSRSTRRSISCCTHRCCCSRSRSRGRSRSDGTSRSSSGYAAVVLRLLGRPHSPSLSVFGLGTLILLSDPGKFDLRTGQPTLMIVIATAARAACGRRFARALGSTARVRVPPVSFLRRPRSGSSWSGRSRRSRSRWSCSSWHAAGPGSRSSGTAIAVGISALVLPLLVDAAGGFGNLVDSWQDSARITSRSGQSRLGSGLRIDAANAFVRITHLHPSEGVATAAGLLLLARRRLARVPAAPARPERRPGGARTRARVPARAHEHVPRALRLPAARRAGRDAVAAPTDPTDRLAAVTPVSWSR